MIMHTIMFNILFKTFSIFAYWQCIYIGAKKIIKIIEFNEIIWRTRNTSSISERLDEKFLQKMFSGSPICAFFYSFPSPDSQSFHVHVCYCWKLNFSVSGCPLNDHEVSNTTSCRLTTATWWEHSIDADLVHLPGIELLSNLLIGEHSIDEAPAHMYIYICSNEKKWSYILLIRNSKSDTIE